jgi:murein DD-endopeptidase MepM/ murein hydrolase activator NlpD
MRIRVLAAAVALLVGMAVVAEGQKSKPTKKALEQKRTDIRKQAESVRTEIRQNRREASVVLGEMREIDGRLDVARDRVAATQSKLDDAQAERNEIKRRLEAAEAKLRECQKAIGQRLRAMYMQRGQTMLTAFIGAETFTDVAERAYLLNKIAENDRRLVSDFLDTKAAIQTEKANADKIVAAITSMKADQVADKKVIDAEMSKKRSLLAELNEERSDLQDELEELEKDSNAVTAMLQKYYAEGGGGTPVFRGRFLQPVSGRVGSGFGYRTHPISGRRKMHQGVDIGASHGTTIKAAGDGRVVMAGWNGGYGNCVIIDHGGGVATLYGHCSKLFVSSGQRVTQGQRIAAVGSTGYSTGPHLHWEVRVNGKPVNPLGR